MRTCDGSWDPGARQADVRHLRCRAWVWQGITEAGDTRIGSAVIREPRPACAQLCSPYPVMILPHGQCRCEQTHLRTELHNLAGLAGDPPCPLPLLRCRSFAPFTAARKQRQRRRAQLTARAEGDGQSEGFKGLFGFVTDNPSSRNVRAWQTNPWHASRDGKHDVTSRRWAGRQSS